MEKLTLDSEARNHTSKGGVKKMRASGKIPAILYGNDTASLSLTVDVIKFETLFKKAGYNAMVSINLPDKTSRTVLIKDIQKNVITRAISHIDFYQISMKKKIELSIPVMLEGLAPGVKSGGVLSHIIRELKVKCFPTNIPEKIVVDISNLKIGSAVFVKNLSIPENVEVLMTPEQIVVNIVSPTILEEVVAGAVVGEGAAEPEVISKGKKEEEGEETAQVKQQEAKKEATPVKKEEKK
ncbi:MAG: 50S ribosomal protein L25 [Elusimicrobiota bacterium]